MKILKKGCYRGKADSELSPEELRQRLHNKGELRTYFNIWLQKRDEERDKAVREIHGHKPMVPYRQAI